MSNTIIKYTKGWYDKKNTYFVISFQIQIFERECTLGRQIFTKHEHALFALHPRRFFGSTVFDYLLGFFKNSISVDSGQAVT